MPCQELCHCHLCVVAIEKNLSAEESRVVIRQLNGERYDHEVWNALYESAVDLAATIVLLSMPRNRACQQNRSNIPVDNPSAYWKLNRSAVHRPLVGGTR